MADDCDLAANLRNAVDGFLDGTPVISLRGEGQVHHRSFDVALNQVGKQPVPAPTGVKGPVDKQSVRVVPRH
jgi:hypothetical protein